jgi:hypothetical protein
VEEASARGRRHCCGRGVTAETALPLSYRSTRAPGRSRTCDRRFSGDNGNVAGPQQNECRGREVRSESGFETAEPERALYARDNRATPARDRQTRQDSNPDPRGWSSRCFQLHHGFVVSGRPGSNGPLRAGDPVLCRLSYIRKKSTLGWSRTSILCRRRAALIPLSYERKEPPAGVEPAPRPYKGRVLAVDTTEAGQVEPKGFEPSSSRRSIGFSRERLPGTRAGAIAESHAATPRR